MTPMQSPGNLDDDLFALYDEYCHGSMSRREFLDRATAIGAAVGLAGLAGCKAKEMLPDYAKSEQVSFTDERIKATYATYPSPGGNSGTMRGYLVTPTKQGPFGAVLVVHENRGLNPYVKDVARRVAVAGFLALAPDALYPAGGYPGNDEDGKALQRTLDAGKIHVDMLNSARFVQAHEASNRRLGVTGFCFGGGVANHLAVEMGESLAAAAPFYGRQPDLARVGEIRAELVVHYAEDDPRINENKDAYDAALKAAGVKHASYVYPGTRHGFHNDSTPRYDAEAAALAWKRTIDLFERTLA
jgi:carboxymethylenebutenolidase